MLFIIHIVWGVFFFMAARSPSAYLSFLSFTMWAYLAHGLLMAGQALTHMSTQWTRLRTVSPSTRVIILTSNNDPLVRMLAMNAGASAFFIKGVENEELLAGIKAASDSRN
jgi:FixJ family two-component response regulator